MSVVLEQASSESTSRSSAWGSRLRTVLVGLIAAVALVFAVPAVASANTYNNSSSGSDSLTTTTTLNYTTAHGNFALRVWVTKNGGFSNWSISDKYSIKMYDRYNRLLWSAADQRDRTYTIGGNVTRIVLQRNQAAASQATTNWQRR